MRNSTYRNFKKAVKRRLIKIAGKKTGPSLAGLNDIHIQMHYLFNEGSAKQIAALILNDYMVKSGKQTPVFRWIFSNDSISEEPSENIRMIDLNVHCQLREPYLIIDSPGGFIP